MPDVVPDLRAQELEVTGPNGTPLIPETRREELVSTFELARRTAFIMEAGLDAERQLADTSPDDFNEDPQLLPTPDDAVPALSVGDP